MMDGSYLSNPLIFLVQTLFGLYVLVVMLRFLFQIVRADFYNPLSQFIVRLTDPVLRPLRRLIPTVAGMDNSSLLVMWLLKGLELTLVLWLGGVGSSALGPWLWAIPELLSLAINVFLFAVIIEVIFSWLNPGQYNSALGPVYSLSEPLLQPVRRLLPASGGLDFSPLVVIVGLTLLKMLLLPPIIQLTGSPFG